MIKQYLLALFVFLFSACIPGIKSVPIPTISSVQEATPTKTGTPNPTRRVETSKATLTLISPTQQPTPWSRICSPLHEKVLQDLPEIVSDPYAPPPMGKDDRHQGVDFAYYNHGGRKSIGGEGIQTILSGRVAAVIQNRLPYGNMVIIETPRDLIGEEISQALGIQIGESLYHLYAHLRAAPLVYVGQQVECGQLLGEVGDTGYNIPVAHLHLETRIGPENVVLEPMAYYDTQATPEEMENYAAWRMSGVFRHFDPMQLFLAFSHPLDPK